VKALVVGASGLVGGALIRATDHAVGTYRTRPAPNLRYLDASDPNATRKLLTTVQPEIVFFPAADPNVDWCETHPQEAYDANVAPAVATLDSAREAGARFVFFSSDYVFDGTDGPYPEDARPSPISVYGRQKLDVEERVLDAGATVVRTTTVYGREPPPGKNFVIRLIARLRAGERVTVPADQVSTPTWADELARGALAVARAPGIWHVAGPDLLARDRFAALVAEVFALDPALIEPVSTPDLRQPAARPLRGGLRTDRIRRQMRFSFVSTREALERLRDQLQA
jgi:dTDP-4-dehydrorhamnose reductase